MNNRSIRFNPSALQLHMEVYYKYIHPDDQADPALLVINQLVAAISSGDTSGIVADGAAYATSANSLPFDADSFAYTDDGELALFVAGHGF